MRFNKFRYTFPWSQRMAWAKLFVRTLPAEKTLKLSVSAGYTIVINKIELDEFIRAFATIQRDVSAPKEITVTTKRLWSEVFLAGCLPKYAPTTVAPPRTLEQIEVINDVVKLAQFREAHTNFDIAMLLEDPTTPRIANAASAQAIIAAVHHIVPIHAAYLEPTTGSFILQFENWRSGFVSCIAPENGRVSESAPIFDFDDGFCDPEWNAWFPQVMVDLLAWRKAECKPTQVLKWHGKPSLR